MPALINCTNVFYLPTAAIRKTAMKNKQKNKKKAVDFLVLV